MFIVLSEVLKRLFLALCSAVFCVSLTAPTAVLAQVTPPPIKLALIEGLSGPNASGGEAVFRNLVWAIERVNARGGSASSRWSWA